MTGLEVVVLTVETVAALLTLSSWIFYGLNWVCRKTSIISTVACAA